MPDADRKKAAAPVSAEAFIGIVVDMSRLLSLLGRMEPFKSAKLGLGEWAALAAIRDTPNASNKQLSRVLGVTGQRVNQITDALKKDGLITVTQSVEDSRMIVMSLTGAGGQRLNELNAKLTPILAEGLRGSERAVERMPKLIKRIVRAFHGPRPDGTPEQPPKAA